MIFKCLKGWVILFFAIFILSGCTMNAVSSDYDLKLSTKEKSISVGTGGTKSQTEIKIDSRRYRELSSEQNIYLSYHLLAADGSLLDYDNERTPLETISARGIKKEMLVFTAPVEAGNYLLQVDVVEEGVAWFSEKGMPMLEIPLTVDVTYEPPYSTTSIKSDISEIKLSVGDIISFPISVKNGGIVPIYCSGGMGALISYHVLDLKGNELQHDGSRIQLVNDIGPQSVAECTLNIEDEIFKSPGNYILSVDMVIEGVTWFSEHGMEVLQIPVNVL